MDCPACGRGNAADRMECEFCQALLVDAFAADDTGRTDPIEVIGARAMSADTEALLRAARQIPDDTGEHRDSLQRFPSEIQYTGDLPRLFRFGNRYQILEKLGEGGMGRVYKALDLELDRAVALKTIRTEKGTGREVLERFKQELILARKVTHKNVIRIYDLGEFEGMKFFTMELIEGESLRDVIREKKTVPVKETLSFMKQMLNGLAEAHSQGVVHRDLKPQNIMVDDGGVVRIMDFGIARTADSATMTGTGEMMGTPDYISPEQVKGETADAQSDLYSCGVILYELLTGETPFKGDTPIAKIVSRIQVKPKSPRELNPEIPTYIERIILKCLEVDPELRYHTAEEVLEDLEREQVDRSRSLRIRKALRRRKGWLAAACLAASAIMGAWYYRSVPDPTVAADVQVTTLAVLPFHNMTGADDLAWMENGVPEMLITDISQLRALRPVMAERMSNILRELGKQDQSRFDDETIQVIAQMASADYTLYGRFVKAEGQLRVNLTLRDSGTGLATPINLDADPEKVFAMVDALTDRVTTALNLDEENLPIGSISTSSLEAFRAYQQGMAELRNGANRAAIPFLEQAVELDESYAMAHARLAEAALNLEERDAARQRSNLASALALERELPLTERYQIHAIAARAEDNPQNAVDSYRKLSELYPDDPDILLGLAKALDTLGETQESAGVYRRIMELAPNYGAALLGLGRNLVYAGQHEEAIPLLEKALASEHFGDDLESLGLIHSILGRANRNIRNYDAAISYYQRSLEYRRQAEDYRGIIASLTNLARTYGEVDRLDEARGALDEALLLARERRMEEMESFTLQNLGNFYLELGDLDRAYAHYRDSLDIQWELGQNDKIVYRLDAMAEVYRLSGRYTEAMVFLEVARRHLESADLRHEQAYNVSVGGHIRKARGQYDQAIQDFLTSIPVLATSDYSRDTAYAQQALTEIYLQQGRFAEALAFVEQTRQNLDTDNRIVLASSSILRARVLVVLGDLEGAHEILSVARELVSEVARFENSSFLDLVTGQLERSEKDYANAERTLARSRADARRRGRVEMEGWIAVELGKLYLAQGRAARAEHVFSEAFAEAARYRHRPIEAAAALGNASALHALGRANDARDAALAAEELAVSFDGLPMVASARHRLAVIAAEFGHVNESRRLHEDARKIATQIVEAVPEDYGRRLRINEPWKSILTAAMPR